MAYAFEIVWPLPTTSTVQVTGEFDSWSRLLPEYSGTRFVQKIVVPERRKVAFKFIVNGEWTVNREYTVVTDEFGNENNEVDVVEEFEGIVGENDQETIKETKEPISEGSYKALSEDPKETISQGSNQPIPEGPKETIFEEPKETISEDPKETISEGPKETISEEPKETISERTTHQDLPIPTSDFIHTTTIENIAESDGSIISSQAEITDRHFELSPELVEDPILESDVISIGSKPLTPVTTSQSSFAAVSIPEPGDEYEHVEQHEQEPPQEVNTDLYTEETEEEHDYDTPTNSLNNLAVVSEGSVTTASPGRSFSNGITKPSLIPVEEKKDEGRRENLISRFKGLFRY